MKIYLIHYRILKFYARHGIVVDKIHEKTPFKQNRWPEKILKNNIQKQNRAKNEFERDFYKLLKNAFCRKTMENVRNCLRLEFIKEYEYKKSIEQ